MPALGAECISPLNLKAFPQIRKEHEEEREAQDASLVGKVDSAHVDVNAT
jgi:hypothetical protein